MRSVWLTRGLPARHHVPGDIGVVHVASRRLVTRIALGASPHHVAFSPDGGRASVVAESTGELVELEVPSPRVMARTPVGPRPHGVAVLPGRRAPGP